MRYIAAVLVMYGSCISCQTIVHTPVLQLNSFASYIYSFEADSAAIGQPTQVLDLVVQFNSGIETDNLAGECVYGNYYTTPVININPVYWNNATAVQREILMYHELGHCILWIYYHRNGFTSMGMPVSIMNYTMNSWISPQAQSFYSSNKAAYMSELYKGGGM